MLYKSLNLSVQVCMRVYYGRKGEYFGRVSDVDGEFIEKKICFNSLHFPTKFTNYQDILK